MAVQSTSYITHLFGGGWATDLGVTYHAPPSDTDTLVMPFLLEARNVFYELDGAPHKIGGMTKENAAALASGANIMGLVDFWRQGTAGSPAQRRVLHIGTVVMADSNDNNFVNIDTALEDDKIPCYTHFDDFLIISTDSNTDVPASWDQTTYQNLAGTPPNFAFSVVHKDRLFVAGIAATPSKVHFSAAGDPEDWTGTGAGSFDVNVGDGDAITGMVSYKGDLWIFKGTKKGSIHRLVGSSPLDFARVPFLSEGVGCVAHNSIFRFQDDIGFMSIDGTIRSLKATAAYGDYADVALSAPIATYLRENLDKSQLPRVWAATFDRWSFVLLTVPTGSTINNNQVLLMDFRFNPPRWSECPAWASGCVARALDPNGEEEILFGGNDGFVRVGMTTTRTIDTTDAIGASVKTPFMNYGQAARVKTLQHAALNIKQTSTSAASTFSWCRDTFAAQNKTFDTGGGGAVLDSFVLGTDVLAGLSVQDVFIDTESGGEFRSIQYKFGNSEVGSDLEVHSLGAFIEPGTWSMENA
jgi:hypothetical protein